MQAEPGATDRRCLNAFVVALNQTVDLGTWYVPTTQLQLASLQLCVACRSVMTLHLTVDSRIPRHLLDNDDASPLQYDGLGPTRVPRFRARAVTWKWAAAAWDVPIYSLTEVESITFGDSFNDNVDGVAWPSRVKTIGFGRKFDQDIEHVRWPDSVELLAFGCDFDQRIKWVRWPKSLRTLWLGNTFSDMIEDVTWPATLEDILFGACFNEPIERVAWPPLLRELEFGDSFDRPIEGVAWPASLEVLIFGMEFDQPIEKVRWPSSLRTLTFGDNFNQPIDTVVWPPSLQQIDFGEEFNQPIDRAVWPSSVERLSLENRYYDKPLGRIGKWLPNLRVLTLNLNPNNYQHSLVGAIWPAGLELMVISTGKWEDQADLLPEGVAFREFYCCWRL